MQHMILLKNFFIESTLIFTFTSKCKELIPILDKNRNSFLQTIPLNKKRRPRAISTALHNKIPKGVFSEI